MAKTIIGAGDAKAVKRYSAFLAVDVAKIGYFSKKFMGYGDMSSTPIQMLSSLESDAGDSITYDLSIQLKMQGIEGDSVLEGQEEDLRFLTDSLLIDQMRCGVNTGGRMTRKRTIHDLRNVARRRQSEWWSRVFDELFFCYLSGSTGTAVGWTFPAGYAGFAGNALTAPDTQHLMYGNNATSKADLDSADKMSVNLIERAVARAEVMGGGTQEVPQIQPVMIDGEEHYCIVMHPFQAYDLRSSTGTSDWLEIQKAAAGAEGRNNPIFKGSLGMHNNVVLHKHKNVVRFSDYGAGANVAAARALFLGEQAAVCAFGSPGNNLRFDWNEETRDNGNQLVISTSSIFGVKKTTYNGKDYGVIALDTAAADPN